MATKSQSKKQPAQFRIFLNGEQVDKLPQEALDMMAERVGKVVSRYFSQHPDEYERFLEEQERKRNMKENEGQRKEG